jgi:hypothetical protein
MASSEPINLVAILYPHAGKAKRVSRHTLFPRIQARRVNLAEVEIGKYGINPISEDENENMNERQNTQS